MSGTLQYNIVGYNQLSVYLILLHLTLCMSCIITVCYTLLYVCPVLLQSATLNSMYILYYYSLLHSTLCMPCSLLHFTLCMSCSLLPSTLCMSCSLLHFTLCMSCTIIALMHRPLSLLSAI